MAGSRCAGEINRRGWLSVALSDFENRALADINARKQQQIERRQRRVPKRVRDAGEAVKGRLEENPRAQAATKLAVDGYAKAAEGAGKAATRASQMGLSEDTAVSFFRSKGLELESFGDIAELDLEEVEHALKPHRIAKFFAGSAAATGFAAGAVVTGAETLATVGSVASAGAAAAPGFWTVSSAMAADAGSVLGLSFRAVTQTALHYGFNPADPAEELYLLSVVNLGLSPTAAGKYAAYRDLSSLTQLLARSAPWETLGKQAFTKIIHSASKGLGPQLAMKLTKRKLGQIVPIAGAFIGAGMNYKLVDDVAEAAYWSYRERFLLRKSDQTPTMFTPDAPEIPYGEEDEPISLPEAVRDLLDEQEGSVGGDSLPAPKSNPDQL